MSAWLLFTNISVCVGSCRPDSSTELQKEVKNMRLTIGDMHLMHRSMAKQVQFHRDTDAKNKSELRQLRGNFSYFYNHLVKYFL